MAGQVLDISKHETIVQPERPPRGAGETSSARLYRFPSPATKAEPKPAPAAQPAAQPRKSLTWRSRLAIELAIGFMVWLIWFWWHMLH